MTQKISRSRAKLLFLWGISFVILSALFAKQPGFVSDFTTFWAWAYKLSSQPLTEFYSAGYFADYLPGYLYPLKLLGHLVKTLHIDSQQPGALFVFKIPSLLALIFMGVFYTKKFTSDSNGIENFFKQFAVILAPAVLYNVLTFGQVDAFICLFVIGMLYCIQKNNLYGTAFFCGLAVATKPQFLFLTPFLLLWIICAIKEKLFSSKCYGLGLGIFLGTLLVFFAPFWWRNPFGAFQHLLQGLQSYDYFSVNAFNLQFIIGGNWVSLNDHGFRMGLAYGLTLWAILSLFFLTYRLSRLQGFKISTDQLMTFGALATLMIFFLGPKMHERYNLIAYSFYFFIALKSPKHFLSYCCFTFAALLNQAVVIDHYFGSKQEIDGPVVYAVILLNLFSISFLLEAFIGSFTKNSLKQSIEDQDPILRNITTQQKKWTFGVIVLLGILTTFIRLGSTEIPRTGILPPPNVLINLNADVSPKRLWLFSHGAEGTIDGDCKLATGSKKFKIEMNYTWFYAWKETDISGCKSVVDLTFKITNGGKIGEILFADSDDQMAVPMTTCTSGICSPAKESPLFDEQKFDQQNFQHGTYFDEVYYARAVKELLDGKYPWENTHPALGKFMMTWWVQLTDLNPFQWRFINAFFGLLLCCLICLMLLDLTGNLNIVVLGSLFVVFDFSRVTMSRIATIDMMTTFFMAGSYWFLGRIVRDFVRFDHSRITIKNTIGLALFLSLAISIKWNAVFTVAACGLVLGSLIVHRLASKKNMDLKNIFLSLIIIFLVAPVSIYFLSFQPFHWYLSTGYSVEKFLQDQVNMYQYHSNLKATHGFSSPFWSWPFIQRPMWFYTDKAVNEGWYYTISVLGNPAVWWGIFPAIAFLFYKKYFTRNPESLVFFLAFSAQYFCWIIASRITFIYHYLPSAIFGSILLAVAINEILKTTKILVYVYFAAIIGCVVGFWPVVTGLKIPHFYADSLKWFSTWYF